MRTVTSGPVGRLQARRVDLHLSSTFSGTLVTLDCNLGGPGILHTGLAQSHNGVVQVTGPIRAGMTLGAPQGTTTNAHGLAMLCSATVQAKAVRVKASLYGDERLHCFDGVHHGTA